MVTGILIASSPGFALGGQGSGVAPSPPRNPGAPTLWSANWPAWRGPTADGVSGETGLPIRFNPNENGLWKTATPGEGHSSPVVWDQLLFVSAAVAGEVIPGHAPPVHIRDGEVYLHPGSADGQFHHTLLALAYDARTGREVWRRTVHDGPVYDNKYKSNTYASLTAVADGERVYFFFGSEGLFAFTMDGDPVWQTDVGDFGVWGLGQGISPVLHGEFLILVCDNDGGEGSKMFGVDRRTGEVAWVTERQVRKSWATPALVPIGGKTQMVVPSYDRLAAYDPLTGAEVWTLAGLDSNMVHTPVHMPVEDGRLVFISTGYPKKEMHALRLTAGAPPTTEWIYPKGTGYLPSALLYEGVLVFLSDGGVVTGVDPLSGDLLFQGRPSNPGRYHASPIGYDGNILISSIEGDLTVLRAGREFEIVAESSLPEALWASPAIAGGTLFLRGADHLYAFRSPASGETTPAR